MIAPPAPDLGRAAEPEVLFAAARARRRRLRLRLGMIVAVIAAALAFGLAGGWPRPPHPGPAQGRPAGPGAARATKFTLPPATVAWFDYSGQLHVGNVATLTQHVVATVPALAGVGWQVRAQGYLYTAGPGVIMRLDPATGQVRRAARGDAIFAAPGGRRLYVPQTQTTLVELPAGDHGPGRTEAVPAGWYLDPPDMAVAGGIVVDSHPAGPSRRPWNLAVWNPATGKVVVIARGGAAVLDAYTPPGARYSMLAWGPARCLSGDCPIEITNTASLVTVTARSPLRHGYTSSGAAFSAGGAVLAVFARTASLSSGNASISVLALISTSTGAVRMVTAARLNTTEDAGWVLWLPGGNRLLAGALSYSYAVDTTTHAVRPFFFLPGYADHDIMDTPDINFSAVLLQAGN